jgi:ubiquinone/menaquinone biosynthesis C-methylase UbiE
MESKITHLERTEVKPSNEHLHKAKYPDHWERYIFASDFIKGDKIVDVACGPAYGTALLSKSSNQRVIGLDVDENTVKISTKNYGTFCDFFHISGYSWPFESNSIDSVVSLETFEHLDDPDSFLTEAHRVLKPGGNLILSTPLNETTGRFKPENPFHLREYTWDELGEKVSSKFNIIDRFSQISKIGNLNISIDRSNLKYLKKLTPAWLRNILLKLLHRTSLKSGIIEKGKAQNASVQLIVAQK